ncbi:hypothetical protein CC86DRAFT_379703 [Ophiobolus disseminans]|uniref:Uncharacterized protein n=1 Tax=Ophiobolus disseminans TaxID=1469910 RepID=A0A6A7AAT3_9PLEO|nr:hypothetical protein CC86DRAFT_379703 [Ophiobolus disseminans]
MEVKFSLRQLDQWHTCAVGELLNFATRLSATFESQDKPSYPVLLLDELMSLRFLQMRPLGTVKIVWGEFANKYTLSSEEVHSNSIDGEPQYKEILVIAVIYRFNVYLEIKLEERRDKALIEQVPPLLEYAFLHEYGLKTGVHRDMGGYRGLAPQPRIKSKSSMGKPEHKLMAKHPSQSCGVRRQLASCPPALCSSWC